VSKTTSKRETLVTAWPETVWRYALWRNNRALGSRRGNEP